MESTAFDEILKIVADVSGVPAWEIGANATFKSLSIQSLDFVDMIQQVESKFGISLNKKEVLDIWTPHQLWESVNSKLVLQ